MLAPRRAGRSFATENPASNRDIPGRIASSYVLRPRGLTTTPEGRVSSGAGGLTLPRAHHLPTMPTLQTRPPVLEAAHLSPLEIWWWTNPGRRPTGPPLNNRSRRLFRIRWGSSRHAGPLNTSGWVGGYTRRRRCRPTPVTGRRCRDHHRWRSWWRRWTLDHRSLGAGPARRHIRARSRCPFPWCSRRGNNGHRLRTP